MDIMKKVLTFALVTGFFTANAALWDRIKSAASKVHNSSIAKSLRTKVTSGAKKAYNYAKKKVNDSFGLPYQIASAAKNLRNEAKSIQTMVFFAIPDQDILEQQWYLTRTQQTTVINESKGNDQSEKSEQITKEAGEVVVKQPTLTEETDAVADPTVTNESKGNDGSEEPEQITKEAGEVVVKQPTLTEETDAVADPTVTNESKGNDKSEEPEQITEKAGGIVVKQPTLTEETDAAADPIAKLIDLCAACEEKPIRAMRIISYISAYIGRIERLKTPDGKLVVPNESINTLFGYMRDLNSLVYEYSLPYMDNIKRMQNEAVAIQANEAYSYGSIDVSRQTAKQVGTLTTKLAKIMDDCLKDIENLETNMDRISIIIAKLQERGVNVQVLTTCFVNLQHLMQSMQTMTKFNETKQGLIETGQNTMNNLQTTANMSITNAANAGSAALTQGIGVVNQHITESMEDLSEGIGNTLEATQGAIDKGSDYLTKSANELNEEMKNLSIGEKTDAVGLSTMNYDPDEDLENI